MTDITKPNDKDNNWSNWSLSDNLSWSKKEVLESLDNKVEDIIKKHSNGKLDVNELLSNRNIINDIKLGKNHEWMNFDNQEKVKLFNNSIETNNKFTSLINYLESNYKDENWNNKKFMVDSVEENVKAILSWLSKKERYIAMIYVALNYGIYWTKPIEYVSYSIYWWGHDGDKQEFSIYNDKNKNTKDIHNFFEDCIKKYKEDESLSTYNIFLMVAEKYKDKFHVDFRNTSYGRNYVCTFSNKDRKEEEIILDKDFQTGRINYDRVEKTKIVQTFNLQTTYRDEEIAVDDPYELEEHNFKTTYWWNLKFEKAVDKFLFENDINTKELIKKNYWKYSNVLELKQLLTYNDYLSKIKKNFWLEDDELLKLLDINNLTDLKQLEDKKELIDFLVSQKGVWKSTILKKDNNNVSILSAINKSGLVWEDNYRPSPDFFHTSEDAAVFVLARSAREIDRHVETIYYSTFVFASWGKMKYINLKPYLISQGWESWSTLRYPENEVSSISDYQVFWNKLELTYNDWKKISIDL